MVVAERRERQKEEGSKGMDSRHSDSRGRTADGGEWQGLKSLVRRGELAARSVEEADDVFTMLHHFSQLLPLPPPEGGVREGPYAPESRGDDSLRGWVVLGSTESLGSSSVQIHSVGYQPMMMPSLCPKPAKNPCTGPLWWVDLQTQASTDPNRSMGSPASSYATQFMGPLDLPRLAVDCVMSCVVDRDSEIKLSSPVDNNQVNGGVINQDRCREWIEDGIAS